MNQVTETDTSLHQVAGGHSPAATRAERLWRWVVMDMDHLDAYFAVAPARRPVLQRFLPACACGDANEAVALYPAALLELRSLLQGGPLAASIPEVDPVDGFDESSPEGDVEVARLVYEFGVVVEEALSAGVLNATASDIAALNCLVDEVAYEALQLAWGRTPVKHVLYKMALAGDLRTVSAP